MDEEPTEKLSGEESPAPGDEAPAEEPLAGEVDCPRCGGSGDIDGESCSNCGGSGRVIEAVGGG